ncbi:MAG: nucleotidyltransferase family protein [Thermotogota bacterium]
MRIEREVVGIVLAAGDSRRMGRTKALLPFRGSSFLETVCHRMQEACVNQIVVVVGADAAKIRQVIGTKLCAFAVNPRPSDGMLSSLRIGLGQVNPQAATAVVALVDQPAVPAEVYQAVVSAWKASDADVVIPRHGERCGHPILLDRRAWPLCFEGPLDEGLRWVMHHPRVTVREVEVESPFVALDVDTPEEYQRLMEGDNE